MPMDVSPPAFPVPEMAWQNGMTLRQLYAGIAMGVLLHRSSLGQAATAKLAVSYADHLVEELTR